MEKIIKLPLSDNKNLPFIIDLAGITFPDAKYAIHREHSDITCIEYIISGTGTVTHDNYTFHPKTGDVYMLHHGHTHNYYSDKNQPFKKIWINVKGSFIDALFDSYHLNDVVHIKELNLLPLFEKLMNICENPSLSTFEIYNEGSMIFHQMIVEIYKHLHNKNILKPSAADRMKDYIHSNIYSDLQIADLSNAVNLSPSQATRVFKSAYGTTPYNYILVEKINVAKKLLVETNMTISEISDTLYFCDSHYFTNCFKNKCNVTPSKYRKEHNL